MAGSEMRVGRVSSVNYESGMARVVYRDKDDTVTAEFPILTNNSEYRMPEVGQEVLVAHLSNGSSRGAIIGTLWNRKNVPYEGGKDLYRKELSSKKDAAYVRYCDETGEYLIRVANLHLNGVNKTVLDGPILELGANISMLIESEEIKIDGVELLIAGEMIRIEAGEQAEVTAEALRLSGGESVEVKSEGSLALSDDKYSVTLTEIMERLEALEGK